MRCPNCEAAIDVLDMCVECGPKAVNRGATTGKCTRGHEMTTYRDGRRRCATCANRQRMKKRNNAGAQP